MPRRGQGRGTTNHGQIAIALGEISCPSQQEGTNHHELKSSQTFCSALLLLRFSSPLTGQALSYLVAKISHYRSLRL